ncbi:MAG: FMN reductase [Rhodospirillales bacterium 70-18]|nr:MAG: FMN reductase [Rhodospirillales bacterium 70-18]
MWQAAEEPELVDQKTYREAMARLGAAVNVITTIGPGGKRGFTASAVCSVTDSPPTLLVCLNRTSDSNLALKENRVLCVNTLAADQQGLSPVFAGMTEGDYDARFATANWSTLATGAPVLQGALVSFDCRVTEWTEIGTHSVFFCEVEAVRSAEGGAGLIYFGRGYHKVAAP